MNALQMTWFGLIGVLLTGYIILDGFDLGVGFWYLFTRKEEDRRAMLSSIMPYWDGNEVWLLTGGGAVFAAFPHVYATVFSGFYLALMLVLFALIFRGVSIEFRNQSDSACWRKFWDVGFALGSIVPALLLGVAMGNILRGVPLDGSMNFTGTFFTLLNPYSLLVGVTGLAMFAAHGALWTAIKTGGELADRAMTWALGSTALFCTLLSISFVSTASGSSGAMANFYAHPMLWFVPVLMLALAGIMLTLTAKRRALQAFLVSCVSMVVVIASIATSLFPNMVPAINQPRFSLTIWNASSSLLTLKTMLILALIGVPIVLIYTVWVHLTFVEKSARKPNTRGNYGSEVILVTSQDAELPVWCLACYWFLFGFLISVLFCWPLFSYFFVGALAVVNARKAAAWWLLVVWLLPVIFVQYMCLFGFYGEFLWGKSLYLYIIFNLLVLPLLLGTAALIVIGRPIWRKPLDREERTIR